MCDLPNENPPLRGRERCKEVVVYPHHASDRPMMAGAHLDALACGLFPDSDSVVFRPRSDFTGRKLQRTNDGSCVSEESLFALADDVWRNMFTDVRARLGAEQ